MATMYLNIIGLVLNFTGVIMMFTANPKIDVNVYFPNEADLKEIITRRKTKQFRFGMLILSSGMLFQLISAILTCSSINIPLAK